MKPHLIMPMGGIGSRFSEKGYARPKPLIEIKGKPFLYWSTICITKYIDVQDITFVVLQQHIDIFNIDIVIHRYFPESNIKIIPKVLPGPVYTAIEGTKEILDDAPIIINDCDHIFGCNELNKVFNDDVFNVDGGLLSFQSNQPQFSYIKFDDNKKIIGTVEKEVVSDRAICGAYIFKNSRLFSRLADDYVKHCPYNECYISGIYNSMGELKMKLVEYRLDYHVEFGTPEEYEVASRSEYFDEL